MEGEGVHKYNNKVRIYNYCLLLTYIIFITARYSWLKKSFIIWTIKKNEFLLKKYWWY
jgi:hypothetical protein